MKSLTRAIAIASLATVATAAQAELSTTVGLVTDYVYRGSDLGGAGGYFSVDFETAGFYAGVWTIDDIGSTDGLETDYYFGYGFEQDEFSAGIGYTRYEYSYSGDFEQEIALSVGFAGFGIEYVMGVAEDENNIDFGTGTGGSGDESGVSSEQDYDVITLSWANDVFGVKVAQVSIDDMDSNIAGGGTFDGANSDGHEDEYKYWEVSASQEVSGFDVTATLGSVFDNEDEDTTTGKLADKSAAGGEYITIDISKSFDL